jgi:diphosphomevalonate decarboxylase
VTHEASAVAHPNIALAKYWGKRPSAGNFPAVPSLSVTLAGMETRTQVRFVAGLARDRFVLDGREEEGRPLARVSALLDSVRELSGVHTFAEVVSKNDFPTASGLASSASGFAALAFAALGAAGIAGQSGEAVLRERASDLARRASVSAARSIYGGFVELAAGAEAPREDDRLVAREVSAPQPFTEGLRVLVAVATEAKKAVSSTDGMGETSRESPYYAAWLKEGPRLCGRVREAVLAGDFDAMGTFAEASALAMHACAIAAGLVYWNATTLELMSAVHGLRARGTAAYFTIDAGPHVKVLSRAADAEIVGQWLRAVPGVVRVIETRPGKGAELRAPGGAAP